MISRRVLVTIVERDDGTKYEIYGRYDAVALASRGDKILAAGFETFHIKEEDFVKYSKERKTE